MKIIRTVSDIRAQVSAWRQRGESVSLVPTMGNLHGGHLALVRAAAEHADRAVVSIFVNPTQFVPGEDYEAYPRTLEADCAALAPFDVDVVFAPSVTEVYPDGPDMRTRVELPALTGILCGASRPGHFTGVATVVTKLFNMVQPDIAVFGRKDYQQLMVIQQMVRDLNLPLEIEGVYAEREPDGLAMSSRNTYLTADERTLAPAVYRILADLVARLQGGERDFAALEADGRRQLEAAGLKPDYVAIRRQDNLDPPGPGDRALVVLIAAYLGRARLIDNLETVLHGD